MFDEMTMNFAFPRISPAPKFNFRSLISSPCDGYLIFLSSKRKICTITLSSSPKLREELLVVVGGGAAGIFGAIRAKTLAPHLKVVVIEKGMPLSKVKISGGGRCNVTNGHCVDNIILAENYPRGHKELKGAFFNMHSPMDTMNWFENHGVTLKTEDDGRVFPVSNSSSSIIDCLTSEAKTKGVVLQTGKTVTRASTSDTGKFAVKIEKRSVDYVEHVDADYLLIASGSSPQGYSLASQLGHSTVKPVPSLFTFKINDTQLTDLAGVTFSRVKATLKLESVQKNIPQLTQVGPMLVTHWGLSGPVILRLSAWGARDLFGCEYKGSLWVDFAPDLGIEDVKSLFNQHKNRFAKQKLLNSYPPELGLIKRFWKYILDREVEQNDPFFSFPFPLQGGSRIRDEGDLNGDVLWASVSGNALSSVSNCLKHCLFNVTGKGQFKDEFVTAGGVPLSEISLKTMESRIQPCLYFAGEVLNIDGITGGFNFQNAWSGGFIAGTSVGNLAAGTGLLNG